MMKSMKLGSGGRFAAFKKKLKNKGYSDESSGAIAASVGRKKYGEKRMGSWSRKGKLREALKRHVKY